jgi:hypothetical protein
MKLSVLLLILALAQAGGQGGGQTGGQGGGQAGATRPGGPPALVVQVVDPLWLPMPGIHVTVTQAAPGTESRAARTGRLGFAEFWLPHGAEYSIEVHHPDFKKKRIEHVRIGKSEMSPTAYVQLQFELREAGRAE